jgi:glycosyltransferase involved in cell wall biosynthesis
MNPLISIVIPSYNNGHLLNRMLNSILNQTYLNWEAIIIDNNSTDNTNDVLLQIKDSRFKYFKINNNGIIAKSRNIGIKYSNGEWIAFLDSDDWWDNKKLEVCMNNITKNVDLIYHKMKIEYDSAIKKRKKYISRDSNNNYHNDLLINGNFIPNSSVMVSKAILLKVGDITEDENLVGSEDYNYLLRITKITNRIIFINQSLGFYYININGVSRKNMATCYHMAVSDFFKNCNKKQKNYILANITYVDCKYNYEHSNYSFSKAKLLKCILVGTFSNKIKSILLFLKIIFK